MEVTAAYELPVPIWVTGATLGKTYPSGVAPVMFDVVMPKNEGPFGAPPEVEVTFPPTSPEAPIVWAQEYGAFIPESLRPATAVHRIVISGVKAPVDTDRTWRTADQQLGETIGSWFDRVRSWVEVITGQDLDPSHRVYDAEFVGDGLTFIVPPHEGSLGLVASTPRIRPISGEEWATVLAAVRDGREPPLEELLSRDARAAQRRGYYRRAAIDAATAIEVVLSRTLAGLANELPERQRSRLANTPMLGTLIDIAEKSGIQFKVTIDDLRNLNRHRIDAVHHGRSPDALSLSQLLRTMITFLGGHGSVRRIANEEPDGSEWVVASAADD